MDRWQSGIGVEDAGIMEGNVNMKRVEGSEEGIQPFGYCCGG